MTYRIVKKVQSPLTENTLILQGISLEAWHEIPVEMSLRHKGREWLSVELPADLKPGRYRVFLRARFGGVNVGDSHAWVTDLRPP
jgi:hypothetical protein